MRGEPDYSITAGKFLAGGVSSEFRKYNHPHALFYSHGKGSRIYDIDGNEYIDFTLSPGPLILGHSHPKVLQAVAEYSEKGQLFAGQHVREVELAEKLQKMIPSAELMRFCLDGSEAVQTAFRAARAKSLEDQENLCDLKDIIMAGWITFVWDLQPLQPKHFDPVKIRIRFHGVRVYLQMHKTIS